MVSINCRHRHRPAHERSDAPVCCRHRSRFWNRPGILPSPGRVRVACRRLRYQTRRRQRGRRLPEECKGCNARCCQPDAWDEVHAELAHDWPRLDLLVNCAGQLLVGAVVNTPTTEIARLLEVNLLGTIWGCRAMVPWMTTDTRPRCDPAPGVINVASIFASVAPPQFATYAASKAGVIAFSESLRGELAPRGLNVTVAVPGITQTPLFESASYTSASVRSTTLAQAESATVSPEQVARDTLRAARRRRLYAVVGRRARFYWRLKRLLPQRVIDSVGRRAREVYPDS